MQKQISKIVLSLGFVFTSWAIAYESGETTPDNADQQIEAVAGVTCQVSGNSGTVVRIPDGVPMGTPGPRIECFDAVVASREGVVCAHQSKRKYLITRIKDRTTMGGTEMNFLDCTLATGSASRGLVCVQTGKKFAKVVIENRTFVSQGLTLDECISF